MLEDFREGLMNGEGLSGHWTARSLKRRETFARWMGRDTVARRSSPKWGRQAGRSLQSLMLWVGYQVMKINCIRETARAGAIPLYAELLQGLLDPMGREIAQDVFCLLAVDESSAVVIAEHACSKNSHRW